MVSSHNDVLVVVRNLVLGPDCLAPFWMISKWDQQDIVRKELAWLALQFERPNDDPFATFVRTGSDMAWTELLRYSVERNSWGVRVEGMICMA